MVVRYPDEDGAAGGIADGGSTVVARRSSDKDTELHPVPEEDEYHDASDQHKGYCFLCHSILPLIFSVPIAVMDLASRQITFSA